MSSRCPGMSARARESSSPNVARKSEHSCGRVPSPARCTRQQAHVACPRIAHPRTAGRGSHPGIVLLEASAENREAATQALGTLAAMWPIGLDLVYPRAAYGPRDQIGTVMRRNPLNHLRLGEQRIAVLDCDRITEQGSQKLINAGNDARMRRSCRTRSDDVLGDWRSTLTMPFS